MRTSYVKESLVESEKQAGKPIPMHIARHKTGQGFTAHNSSQQASDFAHHFEVKIVILGFLLQLL